MYNVSSSIELTGLNEWVYYTVKLLFLEGEKHIRLV